MKTMNFEKMPLARGADTAPCGMSYRLVCSLGRTVNELERFVAARRVRRVWPARAPLKGVVSKKCQKRRFWRRRRLVRQCLLGIVEEAAAVERYFAYWDEVVAEEEKAGRTVAWWPEVTTTTRNEMLVYAASISWDGRALLGCL